MKRENERLIKKEYCIIEVKQMKDRGEFEYKKALVYLMGKMNLSRRFTKEYLDIALMELENGT